MKRLMAWLTNKIPGVQRAEQTRKYLATIQQEIDDRTETMIRERAQQDAKALQDSWWTGGPR